MENKKTIGTKTDESPAPVLGSWNKLYLVVFSVLVMLVAGFYIFTKVFE